MILSSQMLGQIVSSHSAGFYRQLMQNPNCVNVDISHRLDMLLISRASNANTLCVTSSPSSPGIIEAENLA